MLRARLPNLHLHKHFRGKFRLQTQLHEKQNSHRDNGQALKNTHITKKNMHLTNKHWCMRKTFLLSRTHTVRKNPFIKFNYGQLHLQAFLFPCEKNSGMRRSCISHHMLRYLMTYQILETPKKVQIF